MLALKTIACFVAGQFGLPRSRDHKPEHDSTIAAHLWRGTAADLHLDAQGFLPQVCQLARLQKLVTDQWGQKRLVTRTKHLVITWPFFRNVKKKLIFFSSFLKTKKLQKKKMCVSNVLREVAMMADCYIAKWSKLPSSVQNKDKTMIQQKKIPHANEEKSVQFVFQCVLC